MRSEILICDVDYIYENRDMDMLAKIEHGLKIRVNKKNLDLLESNKLVNKDFNLKTKRLNRWYWSVYFEEKEINHD